MTKPAIILHLSDIQFGTHHRFTGRQLPEKNDPRDSRYLTDDAYNTLFTKLNQDIKVLKENEGVTTNILVISGDLAEWSLQDEYRQIETFIKSLIDSEVTNINMERVIVVPGNHDLNWDLSRAYFHKCIAYKRKPKLPYWDKFGLWSTFHNKILRNKNKKLWVGYNLSEYGVIIVGFNSCVRESHQDEDHYGWLSINQTREAMDWFNKVDPEHKMVRIAVLHHNVLRGSSLDEENLRDWDDVRPILQDVVDIILHGHKHEKSMDYIGEIEKGQMIILSTGSAGLDGKTIPTTSNKYQILKIENMEATLYLRRYAEEQRSQTGTGQFVADSNEKGKWKNNFTINNSSNPNYIKQTALLHISNHIDLDKYLEPSQKAIMLRLSSEQKKVGKSIKLQCRNVRHGNISPMDSTLKDWLHSDSTQLVLLGAAGGGKTISCLEAALYCYRTFTNKTNKKWIPIYLNLGQYAAIDNLLDIIKEYFRVHNYSINHEAILNLFMNHNVIIFLDAFDEYDKNGAISVSDRSFEGFEYLCGQNIKILITCRSNFFRRPEDIFLYDLRASNFELCPDKALVVELMHLDSQTIKMVLGEFGSGSSFPDWLYSLANRPLFLRMIVTLLKADALDLSQSIQRYELYEHFISHVLRWDVNRGIRGGIEVTLSQSRNLHIRIAERFLDHGTSSLADVELIQLVCEVFHCNSTDRRFSNLLFFFQESCLLHYEAGKLVFSHKSFREYLVAKKIYDLIVLQDDTFKITWFTRNEREFIINMLTDGDKNTLCRWLSNENKYPACNYAVFILGGIKDSRMINPILERLNTTNDSLVKINCTNALAALSYSNVIDKLIGAVAGYAINEGLIINSPVGADNDALQWVTQLTNKFGEYVMRIHICESIDALAGFSDNRIIDLLNQIIRSSNKSVADEAKGALRRL